ncbi:membrane-spanning 4-domains subfamily A member 4A-like [Anguilla anguilla]|uniref:membrane-spanning 4-domains subfamily A member 4A-like n=1 Tax=Anguilla anguilla TaxID=7936 RepID=UPI0015A87B5D|nr:membrane-spanning 4-domains subfamily A member 4A-like [Anguilla anguilla]
MTRSSALGNFLKGDTKALGTVQIMIGVLYVLSGIAMAISAGCPDGYLVLVFFGGLIYTSSGALSVAANNNLNKCLVRGALGMNIISTITAGIAVICFSHFTAYLLSIRHSVFNIFQLSQAGSQEIIGVLLVFSILEFIISICVSAFACRAVCSCPQR